MPTTKMTISPESKTTNEILPTRKDWRFFCIILAINLAVFLALFETVRIAHMVMKQTHPLMTNTGSNRKHTPNNH